MAEELTLATPITTPANTGYRVVTLDLNWEEQYIRVVLRGTNQERLEHYWRSNVAITLMAALNTANLTIKSLHRRVMERLIVDGVIVGSVTGTP